MSPADRELLNRVQEQLHTNQVTLRVTRDSVVQRRVDVERSVRAAQEALRQLRASR